MAQVAPKIPMKTPTLESTQNIFRKFRHVIYDAPTQIIKWHISNIRATAAAEGMTEAQVKDQIRPRLLKALRASPLWSVRELDDPKEIAKLTMKPVASAAATSAVATVVANATRRANVGNANVTRNARRNAVAAVAAPAAAAVTELATSAAVASSAAAVLTEGPEKITFGRKPLFKKTESSAMIALFNKLSEKNVEAILEQFIEITPESEAGMVKVIQTLLKMAVANQASHPIYIQFIKGMALRHDAKPYPVHPITALFDHMCTLMADGSPEVELRLSLPANINDKNDRLLESLTLQRNFISLGYLAGYMVRDQLLSADQCARMYHILATPASGSASSEVTKEKERDATTAIFAMILRAGPRLVLTPAAHALLAELMAFVTVVSSKTPVDIVTLAAKDVLDCASRGWVVTHAKHNIGAPPELEIPKAAVVVPKATLAQIATVSNSSSSAAAAPRHAGLGAHGPGSLGLGPDVGELYRRFPLEVLQLDAEENFFTVKVHGKKMADRCKGVARCESDLLGQVEALVNHSSHWRRMPPNDKYSIMVLERIVHRTGLGDNPFSLGFELPVHLVKVSEDGRRFAIEVDEPRLRAMSRGNKAKEGELLGHVRRIVDTSRVWKVIPPPAKRPANFFAMIEKK
jgi:hypothetical protein